MLKTFALAGALTLAVLSAAPAAAQTVLTFEGLGNLEEVGDFYGPDYIFSAGSLALIDSDAGGSGNTANEPSGETTLVFLDANSAILNVTNGFDTGFSFFYSSNSDAAAVTVWSGDNATGDLLGTLNLVRQFNDNCAGDPNGLYCNWTAAGITFAGIARSIDFGGTANFIVYDNITFGSSTPGGLVPEPATWAMMIGGIGAAGGALRRRRKVTFAAA